MGDVGKEDFTSNRNLMSNYSGILIFDFNKANSISDAAYESMLEFLDDRANTLIITGYKKFEAGFMNNGILNYPNCVDKLSDIIDFK